MKILFNYSISKQKNKISIVIADNATQEEYENYCTNKEMLTYLITLDNFKINFYEKCKLNTKTLIKLKKTLDNLTQDFLNLIKDLKDFEKMTSNAHKDQTSLLLKDFLDLCVQSSNPNTLVIAKATTLNKYNRILKSAIKNKNCLNELVNDNSSYSKIFKILLPKNEKKLLEKTEIKSSATLDKNVEEIQPYLTNFLEYCYKDPFFLSLLKEILTQKDDSRCHNNYQMFTSALVEINKKKYLLCGISNNLSLDNSKTIAWEIEKWKEYVHLLGTYLILLTHHYNRNFSQDIKHTVIPVRARSSGFFSLMYNLQQNITPDELSNETNCGEHAIIAAIAKLLPTNDLKIIAASSNLLDLPSLDQTLELSTPPTLPEKISPINKHHEYCRECKKLEPVYEFLTSANTYKNEEMLPFSPRHTSLEFSMHFDSIITQEKLSNAEIIYLQIDIFSAFAEDCASIEQLLITFPGENKDMIKLCDNYVIHLCEQLLEAQEIIQRIILKNMEKTGLEQSDSKNENEITLNEKRKKFSNILKDLSELLPNCSKQINRTLETLEDQSTISLYFSDDVTETRYHTI